MEPTLAYSMDVTPRKSAMKSPKPEIDDRTQMYNMDVETPEKAKNIQAKRKQGKSGNEDDTGSEFGDNAPTQTYRSESDKKPTPKKITWGATLAIQDSDEDSLAGLTPKPDKDDDSTQIFDEPSTVKFDLDAPTQIFADDTGPSPAKAGLDRSNVATTKAVTQILDCETQILDVFHMPTKIGSQKTKKVAHYAADEPTQIFSLNEAEETQILADGTPTINVRTKVTVLSKQAVDSPNCGMGGVGEATQLLDEATQILGDATQILDDFVEDAGTPILTTRHTPTRPNRNTAHTSTLEFNPQISSTQIRPDRADEPTQV